MGPDLNRYPFVLVFVFFIFAAPAVWPSYAEAQAASDASLVAGPHRDSLVCTPVLKALAPGAQADQARCTMREFPAAPAIDFMVFRGSQAATARLHGRMLGQRAAGGLLAYVRETKTRFLGTLPRGQQRLFSSIMACLVKDMSASVDAEWARVHAELARGFAEAGMTNVSLDEVTEMGFSLELGVMLSGLQRLIRRSPVEGYAKLASLCGGSLVQSLFPHRPSQQLDALVLQGDWGQAVPNFGCTGFASAEGPSSSGLAPLWMSRNLDGSAMGYFEQAPLIMIQDPRPGEVASAGLGQTEQTSPSENRFRYVGMASAGLHYAGGNAGFNEAGIGVTLHEMETETFRSRHPSRRAMPALFLQNRILERASSIDQAWDIVRRAKSFTSWTIVVGDAKTGEVAAFEISARRAVVASRVRHGWHAQANRFIAPEMATEFYNYSYNKVLESRFRLARLGELALTRPIPMNAQWLVDTLSDHHDWYSGPRSFGRNVTKTNTMMSILFAPGERRFVASLADRYPVGQGSFIDLGVDFAALEETRAPFVVQGFRRSHNAFAAAHPAWQASLGHYVAAYLGYKKAPRNLASVQESRSSVEQAIGLAGEDQIDEFAYRFMAAKLTMKIAGLAMQQGDVATAEREALAARMMLAKMMLGPESGQGALLAELHPYDQALLHVWGARSELLARSMGAAALAAPHFAMPDPEVSFSAARALITSILNSGETQDFELRTFLRSFSPRPGRYSNFAAPEAAAMDIDFVTVE